MKKLLLAITLGVSTIGFSQADVAVTLNSPAAGSTISSGTQFSIDFTVSNVGTEAIDANDSIIIYPKINGSYLPNPNNPNVALATYTQQAIPAGSTGNVTFNFGLQGGQDATYDFCIEVLMRGAGWTGVTEANTTDNEGCNTVNYVVSGGVGIGELRAISAVDESYYANGIYHVRMKYQSLVGATSLSVYSISGAEVYNVSLSNDGSSIDEDVNLSGLKKGIYLVEVKGLSNRSVKKIAIQ